MWVGCGWVGGAVFVLSISLCRLIFLSLLRPIDLSPPAFVQDPLTRQTSIADVISSVSPGPATQPMSFLNPQPA